MAAGPMVGTQRTVPGVVKRLVQSAVCLVISHCCAIADGMHAVTRQNCPSAEHSSALPIRQAQLRCVERILTIDPSCKAVSNKRRLNCGIKFFVLMLIATHERRREVRAVGVAQHHCLANIFDNHQGHFGRVLPLPLNGKIRFGQDRGIALGDRA